MAWNKLLICSFLVLWVTGSSKAQLGDNTEVQTETDAANYLSGRNWIPAGQASEIVDLKDLLRNFQMYTGLPVTGILDDATKAKMNSPQCGNPDFGEGGFSLSVSRKKRFTHLGTTWPQNEITWFLQNGTPDLPQSLVRSEMVRAFQYWADVTPLRFREVFSTNADIIVQFAVRDHGDGNSFDGPGRTLAHAFQPGFGRGGDLHFDDDERYTASTGINLLQVAVHEIGHSLGMGHSSDNNAIMAPFYTYRSNFALGTNDINGIQALYGPPVVNPPTRPPMTTQTTTTTAPSTTTPPRTLAPVFCNADFDAATESFDNAVYIFQGTQVFKIGNFQILPGYPRAISQELPGAPSFVDAAFLWRASDARRYLYIFKGSLYWRFFNGVASSGYPRPISNWGLPANIDAVFRWTGNDRIYFFKGDQYYRYNTMTYRIDPGYPRPLSVWNNVRGPVSAVLDIASNSYFFSGQYFQVFVDSSFRATNLIQTAPIWLGCRTEGLEVPGTTEIPTTMFEDGDDDDDDNDGSVVIPSISVVVVTSFFALWHELF